MARDADLVLREAVAGRMKRADDVHIDIITAVAGLMAAIAYSDRTITDEEAAHLRAELARIEELGPLGADAVADTLHEHALRLSTSFVQRFTRTLKDHLPSEHRLEVLDALLKVAAADGIISFDEVTSLRTITSALGLSQSDYNDLQSRYRDKLNH